MKLDARQAERLLARPDGVRVILLHGDDHGLVRERASEAARAAAGGLDDPFRLAILGREAHDRLDEEASALSLVGGRRVVWVRDATDGLQPALAGLLGAAAGPPSDSPLILLEAASLPGRSRLRSLLEAAPEAAVIACYAEEGRALEGSISRMLQAQGVQIETDALSWLAARLGADRVAVRGEVEKLVLYAGADGNRTERLDLDAVRQVTGDSAGASLEDAAFAATAGNRQAADLAVERALGEGSSPVALARILLSHLHRLRQVLLMVEAGRSQGEALRALRPPVFFRRTADFNRALSLWTEAGLFEAAEETVRFEAQCKRTGAPDGVLARRHIAQIASRAASRAQRPAPPGSASWAGSSRRGLPTGRQVL